MSTARVPGRRAVAVIADAPPPPSRRLGTRHVEQSPPSTPLRLKQLRRHPISTDNACGFAPSWVHDGARVASLRELEDQEEDQMQGTCPNPGECQREEEGAKGQAFPKAAGRGSGLVPAACRRSSVGRLGVVRYQERKTAGFMALCHPYPVPAFAFRCCSVGSPL